MTERGREKNPVSFSEGQAPVRKGPVSRASDAGKQRGAWSPTSSVHNLQLTMRSEDKPEAVSGRASFGVMTSQTGGVPLDMS